MAPTTHRPRARGLLTALAVSAFALSLPLLPRTIRGATPTPSATVASATASVSPVTSSAPIEVSAEVLEVDTREQKATLSGKVVLTKGSDLSLKCPKIDVRYEATGPKVTWAKGTGGVAADVKGVHGEAPEFELDLGKQKLSLRGGVRLTHGAGWVTADEAEIDLATARVTMTKVKASLPTSAGIKAP